MKTTLLSEIHLGFAGWKSRGSREHMAIAALRVGAVLRYVADGQGVRIEDCAGTTVGAFSQHFRPPAGLRCIEAKVHAVVTWRRADSKPEYRESCRSDAWEVVVPELVFAP